MQSTKRASNSQPEGSSTKHTKTDAVIKKYILSVKIYCQKHFKRVKIFHNFKG